MIVGIAGYKGTGKDTFANYLWWELRELHVDPMTIPFASGFKQPLQIMLGLTEEQLYGDQKEVVDPYWGVTPRHIMQTIGGEWGRKLIGEDIWVKVHRRKVEGWANSYVERVFLVPDLRHKNEAEYILDSGGILIKISRDSGVFEPGDQHESEIDLRDWNEWHYEVNNNGSLEDLKEVAKNVAVSIHERL